MNQFLCGWLDREGEFYPCAEYEHLALAQKIEQKQHLTALFEGYGMCHDEFLLEQLGWVKLTQRDFYKDYECYPDCGCTLYPSTKPLTDKQTKWILTNMANMSPNQKEGANQILNREEWY